ncbi:Hypothetical protein CINCED_3A023023 [Cinara cedri]|uniref:Uncharacterized protein n=1 Tax=Cinara cedri TaxID=506608 RepID=A0A5E4NFX5_9HEMI|nr:Hypothetical protein CINCED_3A023023 [Cinara cedri]
MEHVMDIVIKTVNLIRSRALSHRQFSTLLNEMDAQYGCLLYYSEIRWLSRGAVLQRFFNLLNEIDCFVKSKNNKPFSINAEHVREDLQLELIDLHYNSVLKSKFEAVGVPEIFKYLGDSYLKLKKHFSNILSMFGSSYVCEQLFSLMKLNKSKGRNQISNVKLQSVLHLTSRNSCANIDSLVQKKRCQV